MSLVKSGWATSQDVVQVEEVDREPDIFAFMGGDNIFEHPGDMVFKNACALGCEGIVSKRLGSHYCSGRSKDWLKLKNPNAPAVKREAEEDRARGNGETATASLERPDR